MMKTFFALGMVAVLGLSACAPSPAPTLALPTKTALLPTRTMAVPTPTRLSPTSTPLPQGKTLIVTSAADSGPGTLRQAMEEAQNGDTITFDPSVFPPDAPATIFTASELPHIRQGNLTIDASNSGVILDGGNATGEGLAGLQIVSSNANTIQGLQISNFTGAGIAISGNAQHNLIGGDRSIGSGPFGQGNMVSNTDVGIVLSTPGTSFNSITGNLIGTDAEGVKALGNRGGVWITEGAHRNTIGPNNVIAYNSESGIGVDDPETMRNTITRNSIHNNVWDGIYLYEGGNAELAVPIIWDFDLQSGTLTGAACANCIVEIFSDYGDEGAVYEGQAEADENGLFAFEGGSPFDGPFLTATVTDSNGNTSEFSSPTQGNSRNLVLQNGNALPMFRLPTKRSNELADNRIGASFNELHPPAEGLVISVLDLGLKRVEVQFGDVEAPFDWSLNEYELPLQFDDVVDSLAENGIAVNYMLHFWDTAGHAAGEELGCPRFQNEEEVREFLDYVRFFVRHFKRRIPYYTIWSEQGACAPDYCRTGGLKCIMPEDYVELVRQVIPVIREEDPEAKIVSGPNVLFSAREELFILLRSDVVKQLDVISWHPIYDVTPNNDRTAKTTRPDWSKLYPPQKGGFSI